MDIAELSDIQSESGVIGTLIYHPEFIAHTENLLPNYFYNVENGCLYWAISELFKEGITNIDAYNISNKIQSSKGVAVTLQKYNMPAVQEFVELYKETARHSIEEYTMLANNIITLAFKRDLVKKLNELKAECFKRETDLDMLSGAVYGELDKLTQKYIVTDDVSTLGNIIDDIWERIKSKRTEDGLFGFPSKYKSFSDYYSYERGELYVVQAKYKEGKSVLLMNEVVHMLKIGVPVLVVDSEMSTEQYTERLLTHLTGIEMYRIKSGKYSEEEEEKIIKWMRWIKEQPFVHKYDPEMTMDKLYTMCKILQRKIGLEFVVYDYMKSNEKTAGENYNTLGAMADFLKNNIAGKLKLPVLSACQLNRNNEVADSMKINRYLSVGIKWGYKTQDMIAKDGIQCGNAYAKIYVNRLGRQMQEDDEEDYIDFIFDGDKMTIQEAEQHARSYAF